MAIPHRLAIPRRVLLRLLTLLNVSSHRLLLTLLMRRNDVTAHRTRIEHDASGQIGKGMGVVEGRFKNSAKGFVVVIHTPGFYGMRWLQKLSSGPSDWRMTPHTITTWLQYPPESGIIGRPGYPSRQHPLSGKGAMKVTIGLAAALLVTGAGAARAQVSFYNPDPGGGGTIISPGQSPTFVMPNGGGGYTMMQSGQAPTFVMPNGGGGYTIMGPAAGPPQPQYARPPCFAPYCQ